MSTISQKTLHKHDLIIYIYKFVEIGQGVTLYVETLYSGLNHTFNFPNIIKQQHVIMLLYFFQYQLIFQKQKSYNVQKKYNKNNK